MDRLRLRPVRIADEEQFLAAQKSLSDTDDYLFGLHYESTLAWPVYVALLGNHARGINLPMDLVPDTFLVAEVDEVIVGRVSIRHELNDFLAHEGGHIGYAVLQRHRRRGYASEILRQALVIASSLGIDVALLTCDDDNAGSAAVIEQCGGIHRDTVRASNGSQTRRYDIAL